MAQLQDEGHWIDDNDVCLVCGPIKVIGGYYNCRRFELLVIYSNYGYADSRTRSLFWDEMDKVLASQDSPAQDRKTSGHQQTCT